MQVIAVVIVSAALLLASYSTGQHVLTRSLQTPSAGKIAAVPEGAKTKHFSELVEIVHQQVNEIRRAEGLQPLKLNPIISAQAKQHSTEMARKGSVISHLGFEDRLQSIGEKLPYRAGAENVAISVGYENPARTAVEGWKNSPGHRNNMLGDFTLTGIGIAQNHQGSYFFTQIFLKPLH
jgi:uncharacterized protein YkwD